MIRSAHHKPIYREVLTHAIRTAWNDRRYWVLALFAGILTTAGSYDVLWNAVTSVLSQGQTMSSSVGGILIQSVNTVRASSLDHWLVAAGGVEVLLFMALLTLGVAVISCASQGALIFAIGARRKGDQPTLREAWLVGAQALWPMIALNVLVFAVLWILRFLVSFPLYLALANTTSTMYIVYLVSFIVFVPLAFFTAIVQIFALNALILQGAPILDAIRRGIEMVRRHWLVIVETAILQIAISVGIFILFFVAVLCGMIPLFAMTLLAAAAGSVSLFSLSLAVAAIAFVLGLIFTACFTIHLQYATWTYLYRRLGEGGVMPKLHRLFRSATGFFGIKA